MYASRRKERHGSNKEMVLDMLGDKRIDWALRRGIATGIGKSGDPDVLPALVKMLGNQRIDRFVRCGIAEAIGELGDKDVVLKMLGDTGINREMRSRIVRGIERSVDRDMVPHLDIMLNHGEIDPEIINETIENFVNKA